MRRFFVTLLIVMGNESKSTKARLLKILRQAGKRISGEELSAALKISRTSVWKAVQGLQKSGYQIDAQKTGYLLTESNPDSLCPVEFGENEGRFVHFKTIGSTMTEARKIALKGLEESEPASKVVTADEQSEGKGRGKHLWKTTDGALAFTLVTYPKLLASQSGRALMAAQIAMANALEKVSGKRFFVRWPNDIWSEKGKVSGILDESLSVGGVCSYLNLGIGVNISQCPKIAGVDKAFDKKRGSARRESLEAFLKEYSALQELIFSDSSDLQKIWNKKNFDALKKIRAINGEKFIFLGIDPYGWATFATINGAKKTFAPGSVSYEKR